MGAIDRDGFRFEVEYSVIQQKGALHVYTNGNFIKEIPFPYDGEMPSSESVEALIDQFIEENRE
jgi:adenine deaminase